MLRCRTWTAVAIVLHAVGSAGCSTWSESTVQTELPTMRIPYDSVVLEAAFVRVPADFDLEEVWRSVDEQNLDVKVRQNLAANGLRSGVVGVQFPDSLRGLVDVDNQDQQVRDDREFLSKSVTSSQQTITSRSGERSELVVVPQITEPTTILLSQDGRVRGKSFDEGQALFAIRTFAAGDGTVRIELTPEIKHGPVKQQWVPGKGTFLYDVGREEHAFDPLRFEMVLSPGQTLLLTGTEDAKGVGAVFFSTGSGDSAERLLLLIRLAQTQYDDLFAPERTREPLATPLE